MQKDSYSLDFIIMMYTLKKKGIVELGITNFGGIDFYKAKGYDKATRNLSYKSTLLNNDYLYEKVKKCINRDVNYRNTFIRTDSLPTNKSL